MRLTLSDAVDETISFVDTLETRLETCDIFDDGLVKLAVVAVVGASGTALVFWAAAFVHYRLFVMILGVINERLILVNFDGFSNLGSRHG